MSTLKCILVIEDDAVIGMTLADCLGDAGFKVPKPICSLEHALVAVEEFAPDAAVLDLSLRDGSGFSLAAELKHRGVPFLVYSGYPREAATMPALQDVPWIDKPGTLDRLLDEISKLLAGDQARDLPTKPRGLVLAEGSRCK
jgi:DNA-binding response OmpR family regulator